MSKDPALLGAGPMEGNMETNLCANCFAGLTASGGKCPVCGKTLMQKKSKDKLLYCVTPGCTFPGKKPAQEDEA